MDRDLYEILMVHPKAEAFVIEAAYRRLAREYHPDVYKGPDAHQRMVELNGAYEILSDLARRRRYDLTYKPAADGKVNPAPRSSPSCSREDRPQQQPGPEPQQPSNPQTRPTPPNPADFGIDAGYLARAMEGAREWRKRKPAVPMPAKVAWVVGATAGTVAVLSASLHRVPDLGSAVGLAWWIALLSTIPLAGIESLRDNRLKKQVFDPRYNPDPEGYLKYAQELAKYQTAMSTVYLSRNWIAHSDSTCSGMMASYDLPKWEADAKGARPCSKCGWFSVRARMLPPPFGFGPVDGPPT